MSNIKIEGNVTILMALLISISFLAIFSLASFAQNESKNSKHPAASAAPNPAAGPATNTLRTPSTPLPTFGSYPDDYRHLFLQFEYPETKDTMKTMLTVIASVLIFTVTFAKHIVKFNKANSFQRFFIVAAWASLLVSLIFGVMGLRSILAAGQLATYSDNHWTFQLVNSYLELKYCIYSFLAGIFLIVLNATLSIFIVKQQLQNTAIN